MPRKKFFKLLAFLTQISGIRRNSKDPVLTITNGKCNQNVPVVSDASDCLSDTPTNDAGMNMNDHTTTILNL